MMRSSLGERLACFSGSTSTPSSPSRASSSSVNLDTGSLGLHAGQERDAFGHALLPRVLRSDRRQTASLLFESQRAARQVTSLLWCEAGVLACNDSCNLFQAFLAHGLGQNGIGLAERIDPVDEVDVE